MTMRSRTISPIPAPMVTIVLSGIVVQASLQPRPHRATVWLYCSFMAVATETATPNPSMTIHAARRRLTAYFPSSGWQGTRTLVPCATANRSRPVASRGVLLNV